MLAKHVSNLNQLLHIPMLCTAILLITSCAAPSDNKQTGQPPSEQEQVAGMQIVDCLLPGQLRKLGNMNYLSPRRPIKTTAADCNVRGGEYVAYDRADYKTALKIWLPAAEEGDAAAQLSVGEIFEKGLGTDPNYTMAVFWYEKAAAQGNKSAQFNLGTMYEQGLGVPQDKLQAINLYRQAWGVPEDSLMYQAEAQAQQATLRAELQTQLKAKSSQLELLERQLTEAKKQAKSPAKSGSNMQVAMADTDTIQQLVQSLRDDRAKVAQQLSTIPKLRAPAVTKATATEVVGGVGVKVKELDFGRYFALIIGNRNYTSLDDLDTPISDASEMGKILEEKYGFQVQLLLDADRLTVMKAINELHSVLGENDNLLIYYAGHGSMIDVGEHDTGYWLPVNADAPPNDAHWISNEFVSNHLGRLNARRVLVVADSCYGGLLSSAPGHLFFGQASAAVDPEYIKFKLPRRSRLLLSSGGNKPVVDGGGAGHSVFARELIDALLKNTEVLSAPQLYASIRGPVAKRAQDNQYIQEPVYKSIKGAGHEVGDFFFVPTVLTQ